MRGRKRPVAFDPFLTSQNASARTAVADNGGRGQYDQRAPASGNAYLLPDGVWRRCPGVNTVQRRFAAISIADI
jgi:hypothetical protein